MFKKISKTLVLLLATSYLDIQVSCSLVEEATELTKDLGQSPIDINPTEITSVINGDNSFGYRYGKISKKNRVVNDLGVVLFPLEANDTQSLPYYFRTSLSSNWYPSKQQMTFTPKQIHFHMGSGKTNSTADDGSEHTFSNKYYPLEMHIVHMNTIDTDADKFIAAVVGILFEVNNTTEFKGSFADKFFEKLLTTNKDIDFQAGFIDHLNMIDRYVYTGSLTTPPYTENLLWNVIPRVIPIKQSTLDLFGRSSNLTDPSSKNPVGYENREIQMRNNRDLFYVNATNTTETLSTISQSSILELLEFSDNKDLQNLILEFSNPNSIEMMTSSDATFLTKDLGQSPIDINPNEVTRTITTDNTFGYRYGKISKKNQIINDLGVVLYPLEANDSQSVPYYFKTSLASEWYPSKPQMIFTPKQIHFHKGNGRTSSPNDDGSEHTFSNKYYPLEMHIVHMNNIDQDQDKFIAAVVGVLFDVDNSQQESFADVFFQKLLTTNEEIDFQTDFIDHLNMIDRYVYTGSLTTPPYTENLLWNVIPTIVTIKQSTLDLFGRSWNPFNPSYSHPVGYENREIQMRNNRDLYLVKTSNATQGVSTIAASSVLELFENQDSKALEDLFQEFLKVKLSVTVSNEPIQAVSNPHPKLSLGKVLAALPEDDDMDEVETQVLTQEELAAQQAQLELQSVTAVEKLRIKLLGLEMKDLAYKNLLRSMNVWGLSAKQSCDASCTSLCFESTASLNKTLSQTYMQCVLQNCAGCEPHVNLKFLKNELEMQQDLLANSTSVSTVEIESNKTGSILSCDTQCATQSCMKTFKNSVPFEVAWGCAHSQCGCSFKIRQNVYQQFLSEKARQVIVPAPQVVPVQDKVEVQPPTAEVVPEVVPEDKTVINESESAETFKFEEQQTPTVQMVAMVEKTQVEMTAIQQENVNISSDQKQVHEAQKIEQQNQETKGGYLLPIIVICHVAAIFATFVALTQIQDKKESQKSASWLSKMNIFSQNKKQEDTEPEFERVQSSERKTAQENFRTGLTNLLQNSLSTSIYNSLKIVEKGVKNSSEKVKNFVLNQVADLQVSIQRRQQTQINEGNDFIVSEDDEEIKPKVIVWQQRDQEDEFQNVNDTEVESKRNYDDYELIEKQNEKVNEDEAMKLAAEIIDEMETK